MGTILGTLPSKGWMLLNICFFNCEAGKKIVFSNTIVQPKMYSRERSKYKQLICSPRID